MYFQRISIKPINKIMNYMLFYTGCASTPNSVGLMVIETGEVIHEISTDRPTGKETRKRYEKFIKLLRSKYSNLCGNAI